MIYDIALFAGTIALFIFVLQLRQLLARVFPTISAEVVSSCAPDGADDLYSAAHEELTALGFQGPLWLRLKHEPQEAGLFSFCALYRHAEETMLAWLFPPADPRSPNRLLSCWSTTLEDGRTITSQAFDPYFEIMATPAAPGRTIQGNTLKEQMDEHRQFRSDFPAEADPASLSDEGIVRLAGEAMNLRQDTLVAQGKLWRDGKGLVRSRLGMAVRTLWRVWRRKLPADPQTPIPTGRLVLFAQMIERLRKMEPSRGTQFAIFGASVVLSLVLGAALWDLQIALLLLLIILVHELGHYLAMRAFGYRNVHMLALPLVGGVTLGQEENPTAAKRAWMSLMGPLPGILFGWVLAYFALAQGIDGFAGEALVMAAVLFISVNYLNLLPVLPLDGGHLMQALLPPHWIHAKTLVLAITCIIGILASLLFDLYFLAILIGLQLLTLRNHFQIGRALRRILGRGAPPQDRARDARLLEVFQTLEDVAGPATKTAQRIGQSEQVLHALDAEPMSWGQRSVLSLLYASLLFVPIAAAGFALWSSSSLLDQEAILERAQERLVERAELIERAGDMALGDLIERIGASSGGKAADPATEEDIRAMEQRLGISLPDEVRALYRQIDGLPELTIGPIAEIERAADTFARLSREGMLEDNLIQVTAQGEEDFDLHEISLDQAGTWVSLGETNGIALLLDLENPAVIPGLRLFDYTHGWAQGYPSLRTRLERYWVDGKIEEREQARHRERKQRALTELADADVQVLLEQFEPPSPIIRFINPQMAWRDGAGDLALAEIEDLLGLHLPGDLRALYLHHDGFPPLQMLPLQEIAKWYPQTRELLAAKLPDGWEVSAVGDETDPIRIRTSSLSQCVIVAGTSFAIATDVPPTLSPRMLWCPQAPTASMHYLDLIEQRGYSRLTDYLLDRAAEWRAITR